MLRIAAFWLATWFGSGLIPPVFGRRKMGGTYGSLAALPLCWLVFYGPQDARAFMALCVTVFLFNLGLLCVGPAEEELWERAERSRRVARAGGEYAPRQPKRHDYNEIVLDEVVGMLVSCLPLLWLAERHSWWVGLGLAFVLFRIFDIWKPWPIRLFDRQEGAFWVMADDVVAGIYAALALEGHSFIIRIVAAMP